MNIAFVINRKFQKLPFKVFLISIGLLLAVILIHIRTGIGISYFTRDLAAVLHGNPIAGLLSNIGVLFWAFTTAILLNHFAFLRKIDGVKEISHFVMFGGILSFVLLIDDFFMLHDRIIPQYLEINEIYVFSLYGIGMLFYLWNYNIVIRKTNYSYLLVSIFFFAISLIVDLIPSSFLGEWHHLFEDGSKFMGIVFWFNYHYCFVQSGLVALFRYKKGGYNI